MKRLAAICIDRPVFASMIVLALVVTGAASYFRLGIDRFPRVDLPQIAVRTSLPNASVEETEVRISQPIEEAVNTVEGITELRSVTGSGTSNVFAVFDLDRNIDVAAQDVRDRIGPVMRQLPEQTLEPYRYHFIRSVVFRRALYRRAEEACKNTNATSGFGEVKQMKIEMRKT